MLRSAPLLARGLVLIFALALAATGLGHRLADPAGLEREQFAQLYGAEFCVTDAGDPAADSAGCPVCHLLHALGLPEAVTGPALPVFVALAQGRAPDERRLPTSGPVALPGPRGPPLV